MEKKSSLSVSDSLIQVFHIVIADSPDHTPTPSTSSLKTQNSRNPPRLLVYLRR